MRTHAWRVVAVTIPAVPVTGASLAPDWKRATEACVPGPKIPSAAVGIPTADSHPWSVCTSLPWSPSRSARANGGAGVVPLRANVLRAWTQVSSVVAVMTPAVPVTGWRWACVWKRMTERWVPGPKSPSAVVGMPTSVSQLWSVRTSEPWRPTCSARANGGFIAARAAAAPRVARARSAAARQTATAAAARGRARGGRPLWHAAAWQTAGFGTWNPVPADGIDSARARNDLNSTSAPSLLPAAAQPRRTAGTAPLSPAARRVTNSHPGGMAPGGAARHARRQRAASEKKRSHDRHSARRVRPGCAVIPSGGRSAFVWPRARTRLRALSEAHALALGAPARARSAPVGQRASLQGPRRRATGDRALRRCRARHRAPEHLRGAAALGPFGVACPRCAAPAGQRVGDRGRRALSQRHLRERRARDPRTPPLQRRRDPHRRHRADLPDGGPAARRADPDGAGRLAARAAHGGAAARARGALPAHGRRGERRRSSHQSPDR